MAETLKFSGKDLKIKQTFTDAKGIKRNIDSYSPAPDLIKAVHLAYQVKRPLLIMGEPGCGKTRLAEAVAYELHKENMYEHFFTWHIKSTTKAQDGLYQIDVINRMFDANIAKKDNSETERNIDLEKYVKNGILKDAFEAEKNGDLPNIVLIDEIDKADIDFPNDLLLELDKKMFVIPELQNKEIKANTDLLIFITSNQEKELPAAFLRRCLYYFIDFPNQQDLEKIVLSHYAGMNKDLIKKGVEAFNKIRDDDFDKNDKIPSTSELLDWFKVINYYNLKKGEANLTEIEKELVKELEVFEEDDTKIPYSQILYKTLQSYNKNKENRGQK